MDPAGAAELARRLEQQAHWCQAEGTRDGRQPATDPDILDLVEMQEGLRLYTEYVNHGSLVRQRKRLIDGLWVSDIVVVTPALEPERTRVDEPAQVARVA